MRRFERCLEVVRRLWTEDKVSVDNDVCTLREVTLTGMPVGHALSSMRLISDELLPAMRRVATAG